MLKYPNWIYLFCTCRSQRPWKLPQDQKHDTHLLQKWIKLLMTGPVDKFWLQFAVLFCYVTSDTSDVQKCPFAVTQIRAKTKVQQCLQDQSFKAWFTSTRGVYHASGPVAIFRVSVTNYIKETNAFLKQEHCKLKG